MMADMAIEIEAMRLLTYKAAWLVDQGQSPNVTSSYAKAFSADACMKIATDAVQIFGGYGYMNEYEIARLWRDSRVQRIYAGSNELMKEVVGRSLRLDAARP